MRQTGSFERLTLDRTEKFLSARYSTFEDQPGSQSDRIAAIFSTFCGAKVVPIRAKILVRIIHVSAHWGANILQADLGGATAVPKSNQINQKKAGL
jgi:hypothetical protein